MVRETTTNLNLVKPDKTDQYSVEDFNDNMQKIDDFAGLIPARALTADKLTNGKNIDGVLFDGTKDISILSPKLTNCILSAPNGVATYSGNTITVKGGLKSLLMNGRNSDKTLKNLELTLTEDISREFSFSDVTREYALIMDENRQIGVGSLIADDTITIPSGISFNKNSKLNYIYAVTDTDPIARIILGKVLITNGNITALLIYQPVGFAKEQDIDGVTKVTSVELLSQSSLAGGATKTIDLTDVLPKDGNKYECSIKFVWNVTGTNPVALYCGTDFIVGNYAYAIGRGSSYSTGSTQLFSNSIIVIIGAERKLTLFNSAVNSNITGLDVALQISRKVR